MAASPPNWRHQTQDVLKLVRDEHDVKVVEENRELVVRFRGPPDTPYHGGVWNVLVRIPPEYPFKSPSVGFMNRIFHPNIDKMSGTVCLDVLNQQWSPLFDLNVIFDTFLPQLLAYPNPDDPFNHNAALLYARRRQEFDKYVKKYVAMYATDEVLDEGAVGGAAESSADDFSDSSVSEIEEASGYDWEEMSTKP